MTLKKGDFVKMIGGKQSDTQLNSVYEVVAAAGDYRRKLSGRLETILCHTNEFYIIDDVGNYRYQNFPTDALCWWEKYESNI